MKPHLLFLFSFLLLASCAKEPAIKTIIQPDGEARRRVVELEQQLLAQRKTTDRWELFTGSLGVGCLVFLILGTAIGAKTRHDAALQTQC